MPEIKWAAATHGDVTFHTMHAAGRRRTSPKPLFGDNVDVVVGIGAAGGVPGPGPQRAGRRCKTVIDDQRRRAGQGDSADGADRLARANLDRDAEPSPTDDKRRFST